MTTRRTSAARIGRGLAIVAVLVAMPWSAGCRSAALAGTVAMSSRVEDADARPDTANAAPAYPSMLYSQRVSGEVHVRYQVDTTGGVDRRTFEALASTHDLFTAAVKRVLPQWRFTPARSDGRVVPSTREERFAFRPPLHGEGPPLESRVIARDIAPDGVPRTVIGPPPPDPDAPAAFTGEDLLAAQRVAVLSAAQLRGLIDEGTPRTVCVTLDHSGERLEPDSASLAWLGTEAGRPFVTARDCPPTYASMILLVDSLGRPVQRGPPGWVDPLEVTVLLVRPWTRDVVHVRVAARKGLGGLVYDCAVARAGGAWEASCALLHGWVH